MDGAQFNGVIAAATNMPALGEKGTYTSVMFLADFPQFKRSGESEGKSLVPDPILQLYVDSANSTILPIRYHDMWRYAAGLFVAHYSTLYLKTYSDGSPSAGSQRPAGRVD